MKKEIVTLKSYDISKPEEISQMAVVLRNHIVKNGLYANIQGKNYIMVDGWAFAGGLLGLTPRITEIKELGENRWLARAEIYNREGQIMSIGFATCSKTENKKRGFDEYAVLSMAQTRAIGKAYRNLIGWVMKMTGYESTPAEEMTQVKSEATVVETEPVSVTGCKKLAKATNAEELKKAWTSLTAKEKQDDEVQALKEQLKQKYENIEVRG